MDENIICPRCKEKNNLEDLTDGAYCTFCGFAIRQPLPKPESESEAEEGRIEKEEIRTIKENISLKNKMIIFVIGIIAAIFSSLGFTLLVQVVYGSDIYFNLSKNVPTAFHIFALVYTYFIIMVFIAGLITSFGLIQLKPWGLKYTKILMLVHLVDGIFRLVLTIAINFIKENYLLAEPISYFILTSIMAAISLTIFLILRNKNLTQEFKK